MKPENWSPFAPYGWSGIMAAGAVVFFAYIGFDAVSTTAEEAKNPSRDLPIGIISSLVICTVLYIAVAAVLTGIVPVTYYRSVEGALPGTGIAPLVESTAFLNAPVAYVLHVIDQDWAAGLISAGAVAGITSVLLVMLMGQPRIFFSMSRDRLLPEGVSKVHPRFGTPYITTIITGLVVAFFAAIIPIDVVGEMTSIGTLFAFVVVCSAVIMLRIKRPEARRPFRVPFGYLFPVLGVVSCLYLMLSLSAATWVRFLVWLDLGMMIYWFYGRTHSPLADKAEQAAQGGAERAGNVVTMLGALGLFNGFFMTVLGFMTEFGITTEATTKWHEIHVTPHQADTVGLVPPRGRRGRLLRGTDPREVGREARSRLALGRVLLALFLARVLALDLHLVADGEGEGAAREHAGHDPLHVAPDRAGEGGPPPLHEHADRRVGKPGPAHEEGIGVDLLVDLEAQAPRPPGRSPARAGRCARPGWRRRGPAALRSRPASKGVSTQPESRTTPSSTSMPTASKGP